MTFDAATSLRLIREGLGLLDRLGAQAVSVRNVELVEQTLVVEITVDSDDPIALRGELSGVMGALSGLDIPSLFPALDVRLFGVRGFDAAGEELIWIVSSLEAAADAGAGRPIEWLSGSIIQENTAGYRRAQADRLVGQLETALRDLIDHHGSSQVGSYEAVLWSAGDLRDLRRQARREGRDPIDSRVLLEFAYLSDLGDMFEQHVSWFQDGCLLDVAALQTELLRLNLVRRKVAHHRAIDEADLVVLRDASPRVLGPIGAAHPDLVDDFLVERWEQQTTAILDVAQKGMNVVVPERGTVSEVACRSAASEALDAQRATIARAESALQRLVVPPSRSSLADRLNTAIAKWRVALEAMSALAARPEATLAEVQAGGRDYSAALEEVGALSRQIKAIRLGLDPSIP